MSVAEAVAAISTITELVKQFPELISAIEAVIADLKAGKDATPAVKAAQVAAAEKFLGI